MALLNIKNEVLVRLYLVAAMLLGAVGLVIMLRLFR